MYFPHLQVHKNILFWKINNTFFDHLYTWVKYTRNWNDNVWRRRYRLVSGLSCVFLLYCFIPFSPLIRTVQVGYLSWGAVEAQLRCSCGAVEVQLRCSWGAVEVQLRCSWHQGDAVVTTLFALAGATRLTVWNKAYLRTPCYIFIAWWNKNSFLNKIVCLVCCLKYTRTWKWNIF